MKYSRPSKSKDWYEIHLDAGQTARYRGDPDYRYEISEVCADILAEHGWVGQEVRVVGRDQSGTSYLARFRYDS